MLEQGRNPSTQPRYCGAMQLSKGKGDDFEKDPLVHGQEVKFVVSCCDAIILAGNDSEFSSTVDSAVKVTRMGFQGPRGITDIYNIILFRGYGGAVDIVGCLRLQL